MLGDSAAAVDMGTAEKNGDTASDATVQYRIQYHEVGCEDQSRKHEEASADLFYQHSAAAARQNIKRDNRCQRLQTQSKEK